MKILSIVVENFKPFSRLELPGKMANVSELPNGLYTIKGRNSSGKSSLIEAILWGLWGSKRDCGVIEESKDRLIKKDASKCKVQLDFQVGDSRYRIKREKTRGKPTLATISKYNLKGVVDSQRHPKLAYFEISTLFRNTPNQSKIPRSALSYKCGTKLELFRNHSLSKNFQDLCSRFQILTKHLIYLSGDSKNDYRFLFKLLNSTLKTIAFKNKW